jgi:hypothetical protein
MTILPRTRQTFEKLPQDEGARREAMQDVFGEHLFQLRSAVMAQLEGLVNDPHKRASLGAIRSKPYDAVGGMSEADKGSAVALARAAVHLYIQHLMAMLDDEGVHMKMGDSYFLHYRLVLEVLRLLDGEVVNEYVVNRSPLPTLGEKYGKWLNQAGDLGISLGSEIGQ